MNTVVVENLFESAPVHTAILYAAGQHASCTAFRLMQLREGKQFLVADAPVTIEGVGLITPVIEGTPQPNSGHRDQPLYYRKVIIETNNTEATKEWVIQAAKDFEALRETFEKNDDKLLILTWDGDYWDDEYDAPLRNTLYLPGDELQKISNDLELFLNSRDDYVSVDVPWTRTYMLHGATVPIPLDLFRWRLNVSIDIAGLPGTGKTTLIHALASKFHKNVGFVDFSAQNATDKEIRRAIRKLPDDAFLIIEDIDALFKDRKGEETNVTFSGLLNILDGLVKNTGTKWLTPLTKRTELHSVRVPHRTRHLHDDQLLTENRGRGTQASRRLLSQV